MTSEIKYLVNEAEALIFAIHNLIEDQQDAGNFKNYNEITNLWYKLGTVFNNISEDIEDAKDLLSDKAYASYKFIDSRVGK